MKKTLAVLLTSAAMFGALPAAPAQAAGPCVVDTTIDPGASFTQRCTVTNPNNPDAGLRFLGMSAVNVYKDVAPIGSNGGEDILQSGAGASTFLGFFSTDILAQRVVSTGAVDVLKTPTFVSVGCDNKPIAAFNCPIEVVRGLGGLNATFNSRDYAIVIRQSDEGDQSAYIGWYFTFSYTIGLCIPASCVPAPKIGLDPA